MSARGGSGFIRGVGDPPSLRASAGEVGVTEASSCLRRLYLFFRVRSWKPKKAEAPMERMMISKRGEMRGLGLFIYGWRGERIDGG